MHNCKLSYELKPYKEGGGHHALAKSAFKGDPNYNPREVLALPNSELKRLGINHDKISAAQHTLYSEFAKTGKDLTWKDMKQIEVAAFMQGGDRATLELAEDVVNKTQQELKERGVQIRRTPWGSNK